MLATYYTLAAVVLSACGVIASALEGESLRQGIIYGLIALAGNAVAVTLFVMKVLL